MPGGISGSQQDIDTIEAAVTHATYGLSALNTDLDAVLASMSSGPWVDAVNTSPTLTNNALEQDIGEVTGLSTGKRRFLVELGLNNLPVGATVRFYTKPDGANYSCAEHLNVTVGATGNRAVAQEFLSGTSAVKVTLQGTAGVGATQIGVKVSHRLG